MKPSMVKAGIFTAVTAAAFSTVAGLIPATALGSPVLPDLPQRLAGKTVFLDPGHQGPNHNQDVAKQVDDGRGGTKACQTSGMTTVNGVPEHAVTWNVAQLVRTSLEGLGARVVLSRADDTGWGGCVDERARAANASGADIAISIHADSADPGARGFHLIVPQLPVPDARVTEVQSGAGLAATRAMRDAYKQAGFPVAAYNGAADGLQTRADIAGPALTTVPDVFLEMGNGANVEDAAQLETKEGQLQHAVTITTGAVSYLLGLAVPEVGTDQVVGDAVSPPAQPAHRQVPPTSSAPAAPALPGSTTPVDPKNAAPGTTPVDPPAVAPSSAPVVPEVVPQASAPAEQSIPQAPAPAPAPGVTTPPSVPPVPPAELRAPSDAQPQAGKQDQPVEPQLAVPGQPAPVAPSGQPQPSAEPKIEQVQPAPADKQAPKASSGVATLPGGIRPISAPLNPAAPVAPNPNGGAPSLPGVPAKPGGTLPNPGEPAPGAASPGAVTPGGAPTLPTDKNPKGTDALDLDSMAGLVTTAVQMFGPLAKMLMGQNGVASDLINVAYSLVSVLSSSLLTSPAK